MHERTQIELSAADRAELKTIVANRNSPQNCLAGQDHLAERLFASRMVKTAEAENTCAHPERKKAAHNRAAFIGRPDSAKPYVRSALLSEVVSANVL